MRSCRVRAAVEPVKGCAAATPVHSRGRLLGGGTGKSLGCAFKALAPRAREPEPLFSVSLPGLCACSIEEGTV